MAVEPSLCPIIPAALIHGEPCLRFRPLILAKSSRIVLQTEASSVLQEAISYDIPLQRVLMELPVLLGRPDLLAIDENRGFLDAQTKNLTLSRNKTPEKHPDLTFSSVSTSPQVALYWLESVMNLTQHLGLCEICVSKCTSFSSVVLPERVPIPSKSEPGPLGEPKFEDVSCMGELGTCVPDLSTTRD